jgi:hypothetical protein
MLNNHVFRLLNDDFFFGMGDSRFLDLFQKRWLNNSVLAFALAVTLTLTRSLDGTFHSVFPVDFAGGWMSGHQDRVRSYLRIVLGGRRDDLDRGSRRRRDHGAVSSCRRVNNTSQCWREDPGWVLIDTSGGRWCNRMGRSGSGRRRRLGHLTSSRRQLLNHDCMRRRRFLHNKCLLIYLFPLSSTRFNDEDLLHHLPFPLPTLFCLVDANEIAQLRTNVIEVEVLADVAEKITEAELLTTAESVAQLGSSCVGEDGLSGESCHKGMLQGECCMHGDRMFSARCDSDRKGRRNQEC